MAAKEEPRKHQPVYYPDRNLVSVRIAKRRISTRFFLRSHNPKRKTPKRCAPKRERARLLEGVARSGCARLGAVDILVWAAERWVRRKRFRVQGLEVYMGGSERWHTNMLDALQGELTCRMPCRVN